jgi:hypothetical protein
MKERERDKEREKYRDGEIRDKHKNEILTKFIQILKR